MGALSLNGSTEFKHGFGPLLPGATQVPFGDVDALTQGARRGDVAAFIVEPIQGKGVYELDAEPGAPCRRRSRRRARCSSATRSRRASDAPASSTRSSTTGSTPDIITVSKALSGGFVPVGADADERRIYRSVYSSMDRALVHSTTFKGNQLAMVAGLATLSVFDDERIIEHALTWVTSGDQRLAT